MKSIWTLFVAFILLQSCTSVYHVPDPIVMAGHREKGDANLSIGGQITDWTEEFCLNTSIAAGNHFTVQGGLMVGSGGDGNGSWSGSGRTLTIGGGYYMPLGTYGSFEATGGLTSGKISNTNHNSSNSDIDLSYNKYFLQYSLSRNSKHWFTGVGFRYAFLDYFDVNTSNEYYYQKMMNTNFNLIEMSVNLGVGGKYCKIIAFATADIYSFKNEIPDNEELAFGLSLRFFMN